MPSSGGKKQSPAKHAGKNKSKGSTSKSPPSTLSFKTLLIGALGAAILAAVGAWYTHSIWTRPQSAPPRTRASEPSLLIPLPGKTHLDADVTKREAVKDAFLHAWHAYEKHAWGDDDFHPISQSGSNMTSAGGIGYTIVDTIDTIMLMGLKDEYVRAREWIEKDLTFDRDAKFSTFEVTIRVLGGLLSAYHLSPAFTPTGEHDPLYLQKAQDLGDRLLGAFQTPSGLPLSQVNLAESTGVPDTDNGGLVGTAEVATLQLELKYLSHLTEDDRYWKAAERVMEIIKAGLAGGLAPIFMRPDVGQFITSDIRLGSRGDSYYEYLLKQWLQTDRTESVYREMYDIAMTDIDAHLFKDSPHNKMRYTAELIPHQGGQSDGGHGVQWRLVPKQDHLVCFLAGSLLLGVTEGNMPVPPDPTSFSPSEIRDWRNGVGLMKTCMATHETTTGLSPEIVHFRTNTDPNWVREKAPSDWYIKGMVGKEDDTYDARYMLRPETVESLFIGHRLTGHQKYRDWGWQIFQAIEKHCKVAHGGFATVINVDSSKVKHEDRMETFFLSETLKYLYLLFDDVEKVSLKDVVFNTEAHILPVFKPNFETGFM